VTRYTRDFAWTMERSTRPGGKGTAKAITTSICGQMADFPSRGSIGFGWTELGC
jgi:hypothetical protein